MLVHSLAGPNDAEADLRCVYTRLERRCYIMVLETCTTYAGNGFCGTLYSRHHFVYTMDPFLASRLYGMLGIMNITSCRRGLVLRPSEQHRVLVIAQRVLAEQTRGRLVDRQALIDYH